MVKIAIRDNVWFMIPLWWHGGMRPISGDTLGGSGMPPARSVNLQQPSKFGHEVSWSLLCLCKACTSVLGIWKPPALSLEGQELLSGLEHLSNPCTSTTGPWEPHTCAQGCWKLQPKFRRVCRSERTLAQRVAQAHQAFGSLLPFQAKGRRFQAALVASTKLAHMHKVLGTLDQIQRGQPHRTQAGVGSGAKMRHHTHCPGHCPAYFMWVTHWPLHQVMQTIVTPLDPPHQICRE